MRSRPRRLERSEMHKIGKGSYGQVYGVSDPTKLVKVIENGKGMKKHLHKLNKKLTKNYMEKEKHLVRSIKKNCSKESKRKVKKELKERKKKCGKVHEERHKVLQTKTYQNIFNTEYTFSKDLGERQISPTVYGRIECDKFKGGILMERYQQTLKEALSSEEVIGGDWNWMESVFSSIWKIIEKASVYFLSHGRIPVDVKGPNIVCNDIAQRCRKIRLIDFGINGCPELPPRQEKISDQVYKMGVILSSLCVSLTNLVGTSLKTKLSCSKKLRSAYEDMLLGTMYLTWKNNIKNMLKFRQFSLTEKGELKSVVLKILMEPKILKHMIHYTKLGSGLEQDYGPLYTTLAKDRPYRISKNLMKIIDES